MGFVKWRPERQSFAAINDRGTVIFSAECLNMWNIRKLTHAVLFINEDEGSIGLRAVLKSVENSIPLMVDKSRYTARCHCRSALLKLEFVLPEKGSRRYAVRMYDGMLVVELSQELPKPVRKKLRITE